MPKNVSGFLVSGWDDDMNDIEEEQNPHETPAKEILWAVEKEKVDLVRELLASDSSLVNSRDADGYTPLHRASYNNNVELIDMLVKHGADLSAKTSLAWQPLHSACQWNNYACAARLLQFGADVNAKTDGGQTPLHVAASHGASYETVQLLLMHPYIQPQLLNSGGETAYDLAKRGSKYYKMFEMGEPCIQGIHQP